MISGSYVLLVHWLMSHEYAWLDGGDGRWSQPQWASLVRAPGTLGTADIGVEVRQTDLAGGLTRFILATPHVIQPLHSVEEQLQSDVGQYSSDAKRLTPPPLAGRYIHVSHEWAKRGVAWFELPRLRLRRPSAKAKKYLLRGCSLVDGDQYVYVPYTHTDSVSAAQQVSLVDAAASSLQTQLPFAPLSWPLMQQCLGTRKLYFAGDSHTRFLTDDAVEVLRNVSDPSMPTSHLAKLPFQRPPPSVVGQPFSTDVSAARCPEQPSNSRIPPICMIDHGHLSFSQLMGALLHGDVLILGLGQHAASENVSPVEFANKLRQELLFLQNTPITREHVEWLNAQLAHQEDTNTVAASTSAANMDTGGIRVTSPRFYTTNDSWLQVAQRKVLWWSLQTMSYGTEPWWTTHNNGRPDGRSAPRLRIFDELGRLVMTEFGVHQLHHALEIGRPFRDCCFDGGHIDARFRQQLLAALLIKVAHMTHCPHVK